MNTPETKSPDAPNGAAAENAKGAADADAETGIDLEDERGPQAEKKSSKKQFKFLDRLGLGFLIGAILIASTKFWARLPSKKKPKRRD